MSPLFALLRKEAYHIRRDRRTLVVVLALPVVQVLLFGSAIRTDVDRVRLAIVDPAPDEATLALRSRFTATDTFRIVAVVPRASDLDPLFRTSEAQAGVVLPAGFAEDLAGRPAPSVLIVVDATDPNTGSVLRAYTEAVIRGFEQERIRLKPDSTGGSGTSTGPLPVESGFSRITATTRMRFNPTRESSNIFVPGLMAFVLTILASLMTAISLTREKETGTIEALLVSPLRPWSIILGKVLPYLAIGLIAAVAIIAEARLVFDVPLRGSALLLVFEALLFILASLALGILVSTRTSSQRVAMMGAMLGSMLPNILLSGFIFPIESMPLPLRLISQVVPGQWFVTIARGIMLKGVGLEYLWKETLILGGTAALLLAISTRAFKARLG
ncbi:MAG TPA: ABC transporter permease [Vicinamibacterales bacterium]|nr:ABC transporter permease [Vicinamibacterales bacterium]